MKFKQTVEKIKPAADRFADKKMHIYAAASDYYLFVSLIPILMLLVSFVRFLPFDQEKMMTMLGGMLPPSAYAVFESIISSIYRSGGAAITVSILLTLYAASGAMRAIMTGLDAVYEIRRKENIIVFYLKAVLYVFSFIVTVAFSLNVMVYGRQIIIYLAARFPDVAVFSWLRGSAHALRYLVSFLLLAAGFALMYARVPAGRRSIKSQWPGAVFASVSWVLFSWLFSLYVSVSGKFGAYGYLGTVLVAMVWMFYCLFFLFIGGYINAQIGACRRMETNPQL